MRLTKLVAELFALADAALFGVASEAGRTAALEAARLVGTDCVLAAGPRPVGRLASDYHSHAGRALIDVGAHEGALAGDQVARVADTDRLQLLVEPTRGMLAAIGSVAAALHKAVARIWAQQH